MVEHFFAVVERHETLIYANRLQSLKQCDPMTTQLLLSLKTG